AKAAAEPVSKEDLPTLRLLLDPSVSRRCLEAPLWGGPRTLLGPGHRRLLPRPPRTEDRPSEPDPRLRHRALRQRDPHPRPRSLSPHRLHHHRLDHSPALVSGKAPQKVLATR